MARIESLDQLRTLYGEARERSRRKVLPVLDIHCRTFIALSPLLMLGTFGADGRGDVTPRGDAPGFVQIEDEPC